MLSMPTTSRRLSLILGVLALATVTFGAIPWDLANSPQRLADQIHKKREAAGLPSLKHSASLTQAAQAHAENMAAKNEFEHKLDGSGHADRAAAYGYGSRIIGETIAWQSVLSPDGALETWWTSDPHRKILLGDYQDVGIGVAHRPSGAYYWVVVVGKPN